MSSCECTGTMELMLDSTPSRWEIAIVVPVRPVCHMMVLPNIDGTLVIATVVLVITERLHSILPTLLHHEVSVRADAVLVWRVDKLEVIGFPSYTIAAAETG